MQATKPFGRTAPLKGWLDELLLIALVIVALLAGWSLKSWVQGQTTVFSSEDGAIALRYPAGWLRQVDKDALLAVSDVHAQGSFKPLLSVAVRELNPDFPLTPRDLVVTISLQRAEQLASYRILSVDSGSVDGLEAQKVYYAYVAESRAGVQQGLPVVVEAVDWVVIHDNKAYILSFAANSESFSQEERTFNSILSTVDLS